MRFKDTLEENIEYSNATQFRKSFLGVVDKLQRNRYLRYVVTKHGEPRAVVMSFAAYDTMRRAMQQIAALEHEHSPAEAARAALLQMNAEGRNSVSSMEAPPMAAITERLEDLAEQVSNLRSRVEQGTTPRASAVKSHARRPANVRGVSVG
jgi:prevent-host-death family protein